MIYPLYSFKSVKKIVHEYEIYNKIIFALIKSYKYNSIYFSLLKKIKYSDDFLRGYVPLSGELVKYPLDTTESRIMPLADKKTVRFFNEILTLCRLKHIKLILVNSPRLNYGPLNLPRELADEINTYSPYFDYNFTDYPVYKNPKLYKDASHLNSRGACIFTNDILSVVKQQLEIN